MILKNNKVEGLTLPTSRPMIVIKTNAIKTNASHQDSVILAKE